MEQEGAALASNILGLDSLRAYVKLPAYEHLKTFADELHLQAEDSTQVFNEQVKQLALKVSNYSPAVVAMRALNDDCFMLVAASSKRSNTSSNIEELKSLARTTTEILVLILQAPTPRLYEQAIETLSVLVSSTQEALKGHILAEYIGHISQELDQKLITCEALVLLQNSN